MEFADQHSIGMNQPGQIKLAAITIVERLNGPGLVNLGIDRRGIDNGVEPMRS